MKKRKHEKNFIRNRSGGMKQKLPSRLLSLMCALVLVLSTVLLDLGHISAYAFGDELYLETEAEETAEAGAEAQAADLGDDESQINTELSEDISEDPAEVSAEEAEDARQTSLPEITWMSRSSLQKNRRFQMTLQQRQSHTLS